MPRDIPHDQRESYVFRLYEQLVDMEQRLIPTGLHVFGRVQSHRDTADVLRMIASFDRPELGVRSLPGLVASALGFADYPTLMRESADSEERLQQREQVEGLVREAVRLFLDSGHAEAPPTAFLALNAGVDEADSRKVFTLLTTVAGGLSRNQELDMLARALRGEYIAPGPGADVVQNPDILPTGRNTYAVNPYSIPSFAACRKSEGIVASMLERYRAERGRCPETIGMVLWGMDNIKTQGEGVAQALLLMGMEPRRDVLNRVTDVDVIPAERLGRPRIDLVLTVSGIFRDLFGTTMEVLDRAIRRAAALDEPPECNFIRKHVLARQQAGVSFDDAATRVFSNAPGSYGTNVNFMVSDSQWERAEELGDLFVTRKCFAFGRGIEGSVSRELMEQALSQVEVTYQNIDSAEVGITDVDHYFEYLGGHDAGSGIAIGPPPAGVSCRLGGGGAAHTVPGRNGAAGDPHQDAQPEVVSRHARARFQRSSRDRASREQYVRLERHGRRRGRMGVPGDRRPIPAGLRNAGTAAIDESALDPGARRPPDRSARQRILGSGRRSHGTAARRDRRDRRRHRASGHGRSRVKIAVLYVGSSLLAPLRRAERDINRQYHLGLQVAPRSCTLPLTDTQWAETERDLAEADLVFVLHVTDPENAARIIAALERYRTRHRAAIVINCMGDLMRRTRLGEADFQTLFRITAGSEPGAAASALGKVMSWMARARGHRDARRSSEQYLRWFHHLPAILRFLPPAGRLGPIKQYLTMFCYFLQPTSVNIRSMLLYAIRHYVPGHGAQIRTAAPQRAPATGIYHPDAASVFDSFDAYRRWYRGSLDAERTIGLLLLRPQVVSEARRHYDAVIRAIEAEGLAALPVLSTFMDNRQACQAFLVDAETGLSRVSQVLSLTGFSFVGGPAMNDSKAAVAFLNL